MSAVLRPAVVALLLAVCAFIFCLASDPAGLVGLREVMQKTRRAEELEHLLRAASRLEEPRRQVVRELLDRRCSLGEALGRFRELESEHPGYSAWLSQVSKAYGRRWSSSDEERHYQRITGIAQGLLHDRPEEAAGVLRRLEEDYRQLRAARPAPSAAPAERAVRGR